MSKYEVKTKDCFGIERFFYVRSDSPETASQQVFNDNPFVRDILSAREVNY